MVARSFAYCQDVKMHDSRRLAIVSTLSESTLSEILESHETKGGKLMVSCVCSTRIDWHGGPRNRCSLELAIWACNSTLDLFAWPFAWAPFPSYHHHHLQHQNHLQASQTQNGSEPPNQATLKEMPVSDWPHARKGSVPSGAH